MTAPTRAPALLILSLSAANFAIGMAAFVVIGVLSPVAEDFALSSAEAGFVVTAYALAYSVASPVLVAMTGGAERRRVLTAGLVLVALATLGSAAAPTAEALFLGRVFTAIGAGLVTPVASAVAAAASPPERRGKALAAAFFGLTLAQVVGVPAGAWVGYTFGWRAVFAATTGLALIALLLIRLHVPARMPFQPTSLAALGAALTDRRAVLALLFTVFTLGAIYVVYTYAAPLLEARMGWGRDGVSLFLLIFGVGAVAGNLLGGWLTDRIGAYATLMLVGGAQIVLLPVFSLPTPPGALFLGFVFIWSTLGWCFAASQQFRLVALAPERANVMLALNAASIYIGVSFGSWIGGRVIETYGIAGLGAAGAVVALAAVAVLRASK